MNIFKFILFIYLTVGCHAMSTHAKIHQPSIYRQATINRLSTIDELIVKITKQIFSKIATKRRNRCKKFFWKGTRAC